MFWRSLFVLLYFFVWSLCCLFFFDIQILITPLVSSNFGHARSINTQVWVHSWREEEELVLSKLKIMTLETKIRFVGTVNTQCKSLKKIGKGYRPRTYIIYVTFLCWHYQKIFIIKKLNRGPPMGQILPEY